MEQETEQKTKRTRKSLLTTFVHSELDDYGLTTYEFRLYGHISRAAGKTSTCWQSVATMAKACKMSEREARYTLKLLVAAGMLRKFQGVHTTFDYEPAPRSWWVSPEQLPALRKAIRARKPKEETVTPAQRAALRATPLHRVQCQHAHSARQPCTMCSHPPAQGAAKVYPVEVNPLEVNPLEGDSATAKPSPLGSGEPSESVFNRIEEVDIESLDNEKDSSLNENVSSESVLTAAGAAADAPQFEPEYGGWTFEYLGLNEEGHHEIEAGDGRERAIIKQRGNGRWNVYKRAYYKDGMFRDFWYALNLFSPTQAQEKAALLLNEVHQVFFQAGA
jgi:Helix-turn-helix domain